MLKTRQKEGPKSELIDRFPNLLANWPLDWGHSPDEANFRSGARPETNPLEGKRAPLSAETQGTVVADHSGRDVRHRVFSRDHRSHPAAAILDLVCTTGLLNCRRVLRFPAAAGIPEKTAMAVMDAGTHPFLPPAFLGREAQPKFRGQCTTANRPEATGKSGSGGGMYTLPYQAYAFRGHAVSVNAWQGLSAEGIRNGELRRIACG